jgi:hypothetical protein
VTALKKPLSKVIDELRKHVLEPIGPQSMCADPIVRLVGRSKLDEPTPIIPLSIKSDPPTIPRFRTMPEEPDPIPEPPDPEAVIDPPLIKRFSTTDKPDPPPIPAPFEPRALILPSRIEMFVTIESPWMPGPDPIPAPFDPVAVIFPFEMKILSTREALPVASATPDQIPGTIQSWDGRDFF